MQKIYIQFSLIFTLFILFGNHVLSQGHFIPGYIITYEQDTIYGSLEQQNEMRNRLLCHFRPDNKSEIAVYTAEGLPEYGFIDGRKFISKPAWGDEEGDGKMFFYELLFDGIVKLYTLPMHERGQLFMKMDNQFHALENTRSMVWTGFKTVERENKEYVGKLLFLFQDAPHLKSRIETLRLDPYAFIKLFRRYHTHKTGNKDYKVYYGDHGFSASYTLFGMYKFNRITHTISESDYTIPSNHLAIGLRTDLRVPNMRIQPFVKFTYEEFNGIMKDKIYLFLDFSMLSMEAGISYPLKEFLYPSFAFAGLKTAYVYKPQLYEIYGDSRSYSNLSLEDFIHPDTENKLGLGLTGGFRHIKKFSPKWGVSAGIDLDFLIVNIAEQNRFLFVSGLHLGIVFN